MTEESVDLRCLTTAELLDGPLVTHMSQCYNRMLRLTTPHVLGDRTTAQDFGELQISMANLFRDLVEVTERIKAIVAFM